MSASTTSNGRYRSTPAGRNSQPYQNRRVCAGNTNCIPICPIQAKYDPSVTLADALRTGNVDVMYKTVASQVGRRRERSSQRHRLRPVRQRRRTPDRNAAA